MGWVRMRRYKEDYTEQEVFENIILPNEVKQKIKITLKNTMKNGLTLKMPALDNLTPVEEPKTERGRNVLKELLKDIENTECKKFQKESASIPCCKDEEKTGIVNPKKQMYDISRLC